MSSYNYWELFAETGDIYYYLLYTEGADEAPPEKNTAAEARRSRKTR